MTPQLGSPRLLILYAAIAYSLAPLLFQYTAQGSNPFYFNAVIRGTQSVVMALWLFYTYRTPPESSEQFAECKGRKSSVRSIFGTGKRLRDYLSSPLDLVRFRDATGQISTPRTLGEWLYSPVTWMVLSNFTYAFFVWSTSLVSTAVSSTIFELYPIVMIVAFNRFARSDDDRILASQNRISPERVFYLLLSPLGLVLVTLGQAGGFQSSLGAYITSGLGGIGLALVAAVLSGLSPVATVRFGKRVYSLHGANSDPAGPNLNSGESVDDQVLHERRAQVLWLTILGFGLTSLVSVPISLLLGTQVGGPSTIDIRGALIGGTVSGVLLFGLPGIFERKANLETDDSTINTGYYLTPVLALSWLAIAGIEIPRFDLFVIGAALLIALITLIQANPDSGREFVTYFADLFESEADMQAHESRGLRLGFSAFILALWFCGSVILLRDEFWSESRILWTGDEYWAVLTLSATVFALIFGFRVARLTARTSQEDEQTFELVRRCEFLVTQRVIDRRVLDRLRMLEIASGGALLDDYNYIRQSIRASRKREHLWATGNENTESVRSTLIEAETLLDKLAHNKQQGRDFAELLSLVVFAVSTVGLGIFTRPISMRTIDSGMTGFLSELFAVLLVATVAFLAFHLFDIRRERSLPLLVPISGSTDLRLYFRQQRDLAVHRAIAVLISAAMILMFAFLLYDKWN